MRYKLLFYDRRRHLESRFDFQAPDDSEAAGVASDLSGSAVTELWAGDRRLGVWRAEPSPRRTDTD